MAFGGIAALAAGAAMLLADGGAVFAPVTGMVGGIAAMTLANHERLKLRIEVLEKRPLSVATRISVASLLTLVPRSVR